MKLKKSRSVALLVVASDDEESGSGVCETSKKSLGERSFKARFFKTCRKHATWVLLGNLIGIPRKRIQI